MFTSWFHRFFTVEYSLTYFWQKSHYHDILHLVYVECWLDIKRILLILRISARKTDELCIFFFHSWLLDYHSRQRRKESVNISWCCFTLNIKNAAVRNILFISKTNREQDSLKNIKWIRESYCIKSVLNWSSIFFLYWSAPWVLIPSSINKNASVIMNKN